MSRFDRYPNLHALEAREAVAIWWYLVFKWGVEHSELEYNDFLEGLTSGCRAEFDAKWRGVNYTGVVIPEGNRIRFEVAGSPRRRENFRELEEEIGGALPRLIAKLREPRIPPRPRRLSPLGA